jgi:hypothetical protein
MYSRVSARITGFFTVPTVKEQAEKDNELMDAWFDVPQSDGLLDQARVESYAKKKSFTTAELTRAIIGGLIRSNFKITKHPLLIGKTNYDYFEIINSDNKISYLFKPVHDGEEDHQNTSDELRAELNLGSVIQVLKTLNLEPNARWIIPIQEVRHSNEKKGLLRTFPKARNHWVILTIKNNKRVLCDPKGQGLPPAKIGGYKIPLAPFGISLVSYPIEYIQKQSDGGDSGSEFVSIDLEFQDLTDFDNCGRYSAKIAIGLTLDDCPPVRGAKLDLKTLSIELAENIVGCEQYPELFPPAEIADCHTDAFNMDGSVSEGSLSTVAAIPEIPAIPIIPQAVIPVVIEKPVQPQDLKYGLFKPLDKSQVWSFTGEVRKLDISSVREMYYPKSLNELLKKLTSKFVPQTIDTRECVSLRFLVRKNGELVFAEEGTPERNNAIPAHYQMTFSPLPYTATCLAAGNAFFDFNDEKGLWKLMGISYKSGDFNTQTFDSLQVALEVMENNKIAMATSVKILTPKPEPNPYHEWEVTHFYNSVSKMGGLLENLHEPEENLGYQSEVVEEVKMRRIEIPEEKRSNKREKKSRVITHFKNPSILNEDLTEIDNPIDPDQQQIQKIHKIFVDEIREVYPEDGIAKWPHSKRISAERLCNITADTPEDYIRILRVEFQAQQFLGTSGGSLGRALEKCLKEVDKKHIPLPIWSPLTEFTEKYAKELLDYIDNTERSFNYRLFREGRRRIKPIGDLAHALVKCDTFAKLQTLMGSDNNYIHQTLAGKPFAPPKLFNIIQQMKSEVDAIDGYQEGINAKKIEADRKNNPLMYYTELFLKFLPDVEPTTLQNNLTAELNSIVFGRNSKIIDIKGLIAYLQAISQQIKKKETSSSFSFFLPPNNLRVYIDDFITKQLSFRCTPQNIPVERPPAPVPKT